MNSININFYSNLGASQYNTKLELNKPGRIENQFDREINQIWIDIISSFEYDKFYKVNGSYSNINKEKKRLNSMKILYEFLCKNKISYNENYNLYANDNSKEILNNPKIWIMFIIVMNLDLQFSEIIIIFKNSLLNKISPFLMFEFFLIFLSMQNESILSNIKDYEEWPYEFIEIFKNNKDLLNNIFNYTDDNIEYEKKEFSFTKNNHYDEEFRNNDLLSSLKIDLDNHVEEKLKFILDNNSICLPEILNDDLIQNGNTEMIDKSPLNISKIANSNKNFDKSSSPLFFNKSPTLDSYLLPNHDKNNNDEEFPENSNFDIEDALENMADSKNNDTNCDIMDIYIVENPNEGNLNFILEKDPSDFDIEQFYNHDNLLIIDKNFRNNNHFAILIITNKLKEFYSKYNNEGNLVYLITPLNKDYDYLEKLDIQKELSEIRSSAYSNFIYFPYNAKLISVINDNDNSD